MHRWCGTTKILAQGMCAVCYTLRQLDEEYFGGLRKKVPERDGTAAASAMLPVVTSDRSSFTTA